MAASKAKWLWTNEMVKRLIYCVKEYKSICEFISVNFNSDKVKLYDEVRKAMALLYEESDFGPKEVSAPQKLVKEMNEDEYDLASLNTSVAQTSCKRSIKLSTG